MRTPDPLLEAAAAMLLDPAGTPDEEAAGLLRWLGCPLPPVPGPAERHRALLFRAAARFTRIFRLDAQLAPGLAAFGAEIEPDLLAAVPGLPAMGVSGTGTGVLAAFEACVGEGVEFLSQVETPQDRAVPHAPPPPATEVWLRAALPDTALWMEGDWTRLTRARDGREAVLPTDLCLRRPPARRAFEPPWPLSIGCAAGVSREAAMLHGLLELVERDAAALWWRGGRRGRPVASDDPAAREAGDLLSRLRDGSSARRGHLLDLTTDLGIPVVAALSFAPEGSGFCCGVAARPTLRAAARAAVLEMCQMELAWEVVQAKRRERGDSALNARDEAHLRRYAGIDVQRCALVRPAGPGRASAGIAGRTHGEYLRQVLALLASAGFEVLMLDLTRPALGIPVVRMVCPGLEVEPSAMIGPRLREAIADTGGGDCQTGKIGLF